MHLRSKELARTNLSPCRVLGLLLLMAASSVAAGTHVAQERKLNSENWSAWPKVREQILLGNNGSSSRFQVFEDGVEQADAKIAKDARSASVLILIDVSTSMKPNLGPIIEAARKLIASAPPEDEFEVVTFSWPTYVEQEFTSDRVRLDNALGNVKLAGGSTALFDAIDASIKETAHAHGSTKRAMVLFSDCVNSSSTVSSEKSLTRKLKTLEAPSIYIVCTAPQVKHALETATRLSIASGGMTFVADEPNSLDVEAAEISRVIDRLSSIEYTSTHNKSDGKLHKIEVRYETAPGASTIEMVFRQEYYAPSR